MITLQRSNPTVTQILAAHGCQTTALQDRYDIHTLAPLVFSSACLKLQVLVPSKSEHCFAVLCRRGR
jgi:hypothetical protein